MGKVLVDADNQKYKVTKEDAQEIIVQLRQNGYITKAGEVTEQFREDLKNGQLKQLPDELAPLTASVSKRVQSIFDSKALDDMIENGSKPQTPVNTLNDNFAKLEFQELWKRINYKYAYTVKFDSDELAEKAVNAINAELEVTLFTYVITHRIQKYHLIM